MYVTLYLTIKLLALSILIQSVEYLYSHLDFKNNGIFSWSAFRQHGDPLNFLFDKIYSYQGMLVIFIVQLLLSIYLLVFRPSPMAMGVLLAAHLLTLLRFRGNFNGGSDYMTSTVIVACFVALVFRRNSDIVFACISYIAFHCVSSYFIAGIVKFRRAEWMNGCALDFFLKKKITPPSLIEFKYLNTPQRIKYASRSIIFFEILFPLFLIRPAFALAGVSIAFLFHLSNFVIFGLNRFVFAWLATYPAVLYCSKQIWMKLLS